MLNALDIHVKGIVQGVGFRPFVYRLAKRYLVNGWVLNAADGVHIHAEGDEKLVDEFVLELANNAPSAAHVREIDLNEVPLQDCTEFQIRFSDAAAVAQTTHVSPDVATCDECAAELFDPADKRYRYPFINCTNCGPRFTIIDSLPYDRAATSMREFPMCPNCAAEYADPADRRFHAQPDACFSCGPTLGYAVFPHAPEGFEWARNREESDAFIAQAVQLLLEGGILAVKGLGGFHLACDAGNEQAVARLRQRKHREGKAFAVMMRDAATVRRFCELSVEEEAVLAGSQRPIVLLKKRAAGDVREEGAHGKPAQGEAARGEGAPTGGVARGVADGLPELGVMLPYTPLQHLLMHDFTAAGGTMLVMTSGNVHDEPIVTDDAEALAKLGGIADAVLGNNRAIRARYDDSVVRVIAAPDGPAVQFVRRARGYAPAPLPFAQDASAVFAAGPEQKSTFCFARPGEAFVSQHIGDLENAETFDAWLEARRCFEHLFACTYEGIACDAHPEYLSTKWAREQEKQGASVLAVQHHHAHVAAVMGEHGLEGPVCGIAFDGTGYGEDGAIWGGEVLLCNRMAFERFANMAYVPMPGGAACVKHPLRMAYGVLWAYDLLDHPAAVRALAPLGEAAEPGGLLEQMIERGINTPYTSSAGRLFDAASALLGICTEPLYEGEPAIMLEAAMGAAALEAEEPGDAASGAAALDAASSAEPRDAALRDAAYRFAIVKNEANAASTAQDTSVVLLDGEPVFRALLDDVQAGVSAAEISRRFHGAFADAIVQSAETVRALYGIQTVVLGGGVFMNRHLLECALEQLAQRGFTVAIGRDLPPNDGAVSYGQATVYAARQAADMR